MGKVKKYLLWFAFEHCDFRISEIESILSLSKSTFSWVQKPGKEPFCILELPSDEIACQIAKRSITLAHISELWVRSLNLEDFHRKTREFCDDVLSKNTSIITPSFRINIHSYNRHHGTVAKISKIESLHYLPHKGPVNLSNPDVIYQYFEYYGLNTNNIPEEPLEIFFGRLVAKSSRRVAHNLSLKNRTFIGNTSMNSELSLIMANLAKVGEGDVVYDPFVGTGSLLVAAAWFGAYVFGADIDFLTLHGRSKPTRVQAKHLPRQNESVLANLRQYGLESRYLDVIVADSSKPLLRKGVVLDAVITDPPYGMREPSEKIKKTNCVNGEKSKGCARFPAKIHYQLSEMMRDLLLMAAEHLKMGGRLVTWIPVYREDYSEKDYIPQHSCLDLTSNCEQVLSHVISRRLLVYEKVKDFSIEYDASSCNVLENNFRERFLNYRYNKAPKVKMAP